MSEHGSIERLSLTGSRALLLLDEALTDPAALQDFLAELGWEVPESVSAIGIDPAHVEALSDSLDEVLALRDGTPDDSTVALTYAALVADVAVLAQDVYDLRTSIVAHVDAAFLAASDMARQLPKRLFDYLVVDFVEERAEPLARALETAGIFEIRNVARDPATFTSEHVRREIRLDRVRKLLTDPAGLFREVYGWGTPTTDFVLLLERLHEFGESLGLGAEFVFPALEKETAVSPPGTVVEEGEATQPELRVPLVQTSVEGAAAELALSLFPVPAETAGGAPGLALGLGASGAVDQSIALDRLALWLLRVAATLELDLGIEIIIRPEKPIQVLIDPLGSASDVSGTVTVEVKRETDPDQEFVLLGVRESGIRARGVVARAGLALHGGRPLLLAEFGAEQGRAALSLAGSDSFIASVLPSQLPEVAFDLGVRWSSLDGISFRGGAGLEFTVAADASLGPVALDTIHFSLSLDKDGVSVTSGIAARVQLGPITATVDQVGVRFLATLTKSGGVLGPLDVRTAFKPPKGAGLSIDAGAVTGGGFLFFDPEREQYAGGMHLEFEGGITLNAIGLLTTRMPDGTQGFSLLVIVQASGFTPVQLGFGFTLNGVGGLLGINRTVATEVLRAGVRNRSLDAILFSQDDPTPRAPQIVSTLQSVFPPARDRFTFGPMALIGWGTPTVLTIEVALVLELPSPVRLMVLGRLKAALPKPDAPLVKINMDAFGLIDFERREASVDATLYDSTVGPFTLTGDMALRAGWGDQPGFLLSIGGFHPAFSPPPGLPVLRRLAIALSTGNNPRLRAEAYLAITSNTVQIGAGLEFYVEALGFNLEGGFGFDALLQLSPFLFQVDIRAHLALRRGRTMLAGIDVTVHLDGPTPWHARGEAKLKILFFSVSVQFEATFGDPAEIQPRERVRIWEERLKPELENVRNWSAQLPDDAGRLAAFRDSGEVLVHPLGSASVSQRIVPLGHEITRFGAADPDGPRRFQITDCEGLQLGDPTFDFFAPAQFFEMGDDEKLSSPSFDRMPSGANFAASAGAVACGEAKVTPLTYETIVVEDEDEQEVSEVAESIESPYVPDAEALASLAQIGPAALAEVRSTGRARFRPSGDPQIEVSDERYVVADTDDLSAVDGAVLDGSYIGALEALREQTEGDPGKVERLQVVRAKELVLA